MASIQDIKMYMKTNNITYQDLSDMSQIPLNTLKNLFCGKTKNPRIDTMQAIETALGLNEKSPPILSEEEKELIALISELTDEETQELTSFVDYLISKRK